VSFWEINKKVLIEQYGGLLDELTSESSDVLSPQDIKVETTPSGEPTLSVRGIYVHSKRDPSREGERLSQAVDTGKGPLVVLGFGLGYSAQSAVKFGRPVIVVEKYRNLLRLALELRDFSEFLSKNRIIFVVGGTGEGITGALGIAEEMASSVESADKKNAPSVIRNTALAGLDEEWYKAVEDRIRTWTMKDDVNTATLKRFGRRWVHNLSRNMSAIRDCPGISRLTGLASDEYEKDLAQGRENAKDAEKKLNDNSLPVFLAAAGPSLDKTAHLLRDIHSRCIVVAVDTSLRFFTKNGVQPDFVLVVDPQFWNSRHLDRCVDELTSAKTALIAESAVYPPVLRLPFKHIFLCGSLFPLGTFIENQVDPKGRLAAGGSVATTAWDFARVLGGRDIWIAGLDLSYPQMKTHFRGARFEERSNSESCRFNPVEKWVLRALRDGIPFKARSCSGGQVLTDRRLSLYAAWFENQFSRYGEVQNFSLFQSGLAINGLHAAKEEDFLALPKRRDEIDRRIDRAFSAIENDFRDPANARERALRYEKAVSGLTRGLESIRDASEKGAEIARQALKRNTSADQQKRILRDLDAITRRITESEVKEVAGFLFPQAENDVKSENAEEGDPFRAYLKSSIKLFSSLAEAAANAWK
jgi:hypothetical protein